MAQQTSQQQDGVQFEEMFDALLRASVHAVEQRDPTTAGHSFRVAALTCRLAEVVNATTEGPYADTSWTPAELREIEMAALIHDIGKIWVREEVIVKAKKLYSSDLQMIRSRFDYIKRSIENDFLHRRLMMVESGTPEAELSILEQASKRALGELEGCWRIISAANEPSMLSEGDFAKIEEIAKHSYFDLGGNRQPYLEKTEVLSLQVAKGSLTDEELAEIRAHAMHSINFFKRIPWGAGFQNVPTYAAAHHERLDGSGYPFGLKDADIPIPSKMMTIADIYDALTASDRTYKKAVSLERALEILELEAKDNHIDADLLALFSRGRVYEMTQNDMMREVKIYD